MSVTGLYESQRQSARLWLFSEASGPSLSSLESRTPSYPASQIRLRFVMTLRLLMRFTKQWPLHCFVSCGFTHSLAFLRHGLRSKIPWAIFVFIYISNNWNRTSKVIWFKWSNCMSKNVLLKVNISFQMFNTLLGLSERDVKPRSWLSVVIQKSHGISRKEWHRCPGQIPTTGPCQSWPPNNPHPLDRLYLSLLSTCSWCVVSALAPLSCGSRRIIQVDAAHWWWLRRDPPT